MFLKNDKLGKHLSQEKSHWYFLKTAVIFMFNHIFKFFDS